MKSDVAVPNATEASPLLPSSAAAAPAAPPVTTAAVASAESQTAVKNGGVDCSSGKYGESWHDNWSDVDESSSHHSHHPSNGHRNQASGVGTSNKHGGIRRSFHQLSMSFRSFIQEHTGSIGYLGSMSIAVNSLTGPAMLNLPATFARSGIIPTTLTLVTVCILSALCCMHLSNTISKVKDRYGNINRTFKQEVEYSDVFEAFWGRKAFIATQLLFFCCITCLNISSIVDTSQVVDTFLGHWWPYGGAKAIQITTTPQYTTAYISWDYSKCTREELKEGDCLPFRGKEGIVLTAGNLIVTMVFLPLALMDLKENAFAQILGFLVLLMTSCQFIIQFAMSDGATFENTTWWGYDWGDLFGVTLFNFALVSAIPAWLYEREQFVDVPTVIKTSSGLSLVLYIAIGLLGNMAMPHASENMLQSMMSGSMGHVLEIGTTIFAFFIIGLGIPLFSVLSRLNLTGSGLCSLRVGNLLAVYFPFAVSWFLNDSDAIAKLLSWGGTCFTGLVAFILPLVLTISVVQTYDTEGSVDVYGRVGWLMSSKRSELISLYTLLALTVFAIVAAIVGNIFY